MLTSITDATYSTNVIFCNSAIQLRNLVQGDIEFFKENFNEIFKDSISHEQKGENSFLTTYIEIVRRVAEEYLHNIHSIVSKTLHQEIIESFTKKYGPLNTNKPKSIDNTKIKRRSIFKPIPEIKEGAELTEELLCKENVNSHTPKLIKSDNTTE